MSLADHARAARFLSIGAEMAAKDADSTLAHLLLGMAAGYRHAADQMDAAVREEVRVMAEAHRCTVDHATIKTPTCGACGARRG